MSEFVIYLVDAMLIFAAAVIPLYLTFRLEGYLRLLAITLSGFAIVHALYHSFAVIGFEDIAKNIIEPLSVVALIIFGMLCLKARKRSIRR